jgi:hypothetical protein
MLEAILNAATELNNATRAELRDALNELNRYDGDPCDIVLAYSIIARELALASKPKFAPQ